MLRPVQPKPIKTYFTSIATFSQVFVLFSNLSLAQKYVETVQQRTLASIIHLHQNAIVNFPFCWIICANLQCTLAWTCTLKKSHIKLFMKI